MSEVTTMNSSDAGKTYLRGKLLHFLHNPNLSSAKDKSFQYFEDGVLVINQGKIEAVGSWQDLSNVITNKNEITWYQHGLIIPGFIDTHIHYHQLDMIAANSGGQLFDWLNQYTFPFESKFADKDYALDVAQFFLEELIRNGTTTAMVFATRYSQSINALFTSAQQKQMRLISGLVIDDQNLPPHLLDDPNHLIQETKNLIAAWQQKPGMRFDYAISFRFAPTTTENLLAKLSELKATVPNLYLQTHIAETKEEVTWAKQLFNTKNYLAIYDKYHLLSNKTVLAHGIYLNEAELARLAKTQTTIAFCPTSNLFLGSGLFNYALAEKYKVPIGLGTDVGAGTSFSMLQTLNEAYKVLQLQGQTLSAWQGFYLATLGGAQALALDDKLGNFLPGKEADFTVLNIEGATPLLRRRLTFAKTLEDKLFVLMTLGDDRSIMATYINGKIAYDGVRVKPDSLAC